MVKFRAELRKRLIDILTPIMGEGSDPDEYIKTWDKRLRDTDQLPFLVVNVRTAEKEQASEIGSPYNKFTWSVHFYYLDMETDSTKYDAADERRDHLMGKLERELEKHYLLQDPATSVPLKVQDADGRSEAVFSSAVQALLFDESGQEGFQTFISELHYEVYTDRN